MVPAAAHMVECREREAEEGKNIRLHHYYLLHRRPPNPLFFVSNYDRRHLSMFLPSPVSFLSKTACLPASVQSAYLPPWYVCVQGKLRVGLDGVTERKPTERDIYKTFNASFIFSTPLEFFMLERPKKMDVSNVNLLIIRKHFNFQTQRS